MPPPSTVTAFERTNFFYGLLLDAERLQKDHAFFNGKRWMLNQLALGSGVLCGLGVRSVAGPPVAWFIDTGIAIDGRGREIVVAESQPFNPAQPTDDLGHPVGAPLASGTVEVCLAYLEVPANPVPVLVPDCDGEGECAPSVIREGFVVIVREAKSPAPVHECALPAFPVPPASGLHDAIAQRVKGACPKPDEACVPIARIDLAASKIDLVTGRQIVYSNRLLYELIVCLAEHVANTATRVLQYVSGDGQSANVSTALARPIVVQLVDQQNHPIAGEQVQFTVKTGGGSLGAASVATAADGRASTTWKLGAATGEQQVIATAKDTAFAVTFRATALP
jgi:hypothetical protein